MFSEYDGSGRTRCPAAFDALDPKHQHNRRHDEDDAAKNPSDDRACIIAMMAKGLGRELRLDGRQAWDRSLCCCRGREWGKCA